MGLLLLRLEQRSRKLALLHRSARSQGDVVRLRPRGNARQALVRPVRAVQRDLSSHGVDGIPRRRRSLYKQDLDKAEDRWTRPAGKITTATAFATRRSTAGRCRSSSRSQLAMSPAERMTICTLLKAEPRADRHRLQRAAHGIDRAASTIDTKHKFEAYFGGWGTGTDPDTADNLWSTGPRRRNFGSVLQSRSRRAVRARPQGVRPREAGGDLRPRFTRLMLRGPALHLAVLTATRSTASTRSCGGTGSVPRGPYHL